MEVTRKIDKRGIEKFAALDSDKTIAILGDTR